MTDTGEFHDRYRTALHGHLDAQDEASLAVGHELGRRALTERVSTLEIVENHFRAVNIAAEHGTIDRSTALQFLLQTLAPLDVATRGFLDGTKRYAQEHARAEDLADRDEFRTALVNSLQEGFFVADREGAVVEINDAFTEITGYGADGLPYRWPHPWLVDDTAAAERLVELFAAGNVQADVQIRHLAGHYAWTAYSVNAVTSGGSDRGAYVGTVRDITAARATAARDTALVLLATAVGLAKSVSEVLAITLEECRSVIDVQRVVAVMWPNTSGDPAVQMAGEAGEQTWRDLDPALQTTLREARHWPALTVEMLAADHDPGMSRGILAVLSGPGDTALWLEHPEPRRISADDRLLITALVGHLSLAVQHVRQFEVAREASLTLQRAMLPTMEPPAGFAVRYEPAVAPLEIGGDWYDVLAVNDHQIGIVVGDCVGRGLPAAAVMGQLRSSARALLFTGAEPALLLEELDSVAALIPGAYCTTALLAILDTETGVLTYSSAGHLPGVLATTDSDATLLTAATSVPLAVRHPGRRPQASLPLPPGSSLILFTDGLVERRDTAIDDGIDRVGKVLTEGNNFSADAVADTVLSELAPLDGYEDDVAIVVYRRPPGQLLLEVPATAAELKHVRAELGGWLRAAGASEALIGDIVLAVNEACTNSAEHAYRLVEPGLMRVTATLAEQGIHISVQDFGTWKPPDPQPGIRGRGLMVMRAVSDGCDVDSGDGGTTISMVFPGRDPK